MNKKMAEALNEISDRHIDEAAKAGKRRIFRWAGAVAAILAVVLLLVLWWISRIVRKRHGL